MTAREQLIEILRKPIFPHELADPTEAVADYLLDNGVTIQRWIPVTERLPKKWMIQVNEEYCEPVEFNVVIGDAELATTLYFNGESFCDDDGNCYPVTYWQPLPQAPGKDGA